MRIIDLDCHILWQIMQITSPLLRLCQNQLGTTAYHKVLLVHAEKSSFFVTVIRIQEQRKVFLYICFVKIDSFFHYGLIHRIQVKQMQPVAALSVSCYQYVVHGGCYIHVSKSHPELSFTLYKPTVILFNPWIWLFLLNTMFKLLFKKPQMII